MQLRLCRQQAVKSTFFFWHFLGLKQILWFIASRLNNSTITITFVVIYKLCARLGNCERGTRVCVCMLSLGLVCSNVLWLLLRVAFLLLVYELTLGETDKCS